MTKPSLIKNAWTYTGKENECWIFTSGLVFVVSPFENPNQFYRDYIG
jgi:hypothetical protein